MSESRLQFWISMSTWWLLTQAVLFGAAEAVGSLVPARWSIVVLVLSLLSYLATRFLEIDQTLRRVALILFGGLIGLLLVLWVPSYWQRSGGPALVIAAMSAILALLTASRLPRKTIRGGRWLVLLSWLYVVGWIAFWLLALPGSWLRVWAGLGLPVFWSLIALWASSLQAENQIPDMASAASQLSLLSLNLTLSALFLLAG